MITEIEPSENNKLDITKQLGEDVWGTPTVTYTFAHGQIKVVAQGNNMFPNRGYSWVKLYNKYSGSKDGAWNFGIDFMDNLTQIVEDIKQINDSIHASSDPTEVSNSP